MRNINNEFKQLINYRYWRKHLYLTMVSLIVCFLIFNMNTLSTDAKEQDASDIIEETKEASEELICEEEEAVFANTLGLKVTRDIQDIKGGDTVTFTLTGENGSGNYKYCLNSVNLMYETEDMSDTCYQLVIDPSRCSFVTTNEFKFSFYAPGKYSLYFLVMDMGQSPFVYKRFIEYIEVAPTETYKYIDKYADEVAAECMKQCSSDYDKALWLHDWVLDHIRYDYSYTYCSAEGVFGRGLGTCEAYHKAYVMLLNRVGLEHGRIIGNGHVWTAVKIDGEWCMIDTTWDDTNSSSKNEKLSYMYFGLDDHVTTLVHDEHSVNSGYESNTLKNHYYIRSGLVKEWADPIGEEIKEKINAGETAFNITINDNNPPAYRDVYYNVASYYLNNLEWNIGDKEYSVTTSYADGIISVSATDITKPEDKPEDKPEVKIKGTCQMPNPNGSGFLIGMEATDNPGGKYSFEMLILDCTLFKEGKDAWVYTTGRCGMSGNYLWTIWDPKYGYYWTLFRLYDENGQLVDEVCYGFENI